MDMGKTAPQVRDKKELRFIAANIEVRAGEQESDTTRTIGGYVVKWDQRSQLIWGEFYEIVKKGAFARSLKENVIKGLWNHRTDYVLGSTKSGTLRLSEDDVGLAFEIDLPNNSWGNDAWESISRGDVDGVSFGFNVRKTDWLYIEDEDVWERSLIDVNLFEVSPTPFPAYEGSSEVDVRSWLESEGASTREERQRAEQEKFMLELDLLELA